MNAPTLSDILQAAERIRPFAHRTPDRLPFQAKGAGAGA